MAERPDDTIQSLVDLGLTVAEAEVYTCLVRTGVRTGYRVAKALGKPAANVYQALRSLRAKGAIVVDEGETQQCRAVAPAELLDRLEREFRATRRRAAEAFSRLPAPAPDARIYQLASGAQVLERARQMLGRARTVVVVDAFAGPLDLLGPDLEAVAARGVPVVVKAYAPVDLQDVEVFVEPRGDSIRERWPADWINITTDGSEVLMALLERDGDGVVQAVWSESPYLSWIFYGYLSQEILTTAADIALRRENGKHPSVERVRAAFDRVRGLFPLDAPGYVRLREQIRVTAGEPAVVPSRE